MTKEGLKNNCIQKKTDKEFTLEVVKIGDQLHDLVLLFTMLTLRYMIQKNQLCLKLSAKYNIIHLQK